MVTYQSVLNAEYQKKLGRGAEPLEIAIHPFREKVEEVFASHVKLQEQIKELKKELINTNRKLKNLESKFNFKAKD